MTRWVRSTSVRAGPAQGARIVLLTADGVSTTESAEKGGGTRTTVVAWRAAVPRPASSGWPITTGRGGPRRSDHRATVPATLRPPPKKLRVIRWPSRLLVSRPEIDRSTVAKAWRESEVAP